MLAHHPRRRTASPHEIFQTSTVSALLAGIYEGDLTVGELLTHGDFGVGTFNQLDGEMIVLDRTCYRLRADGSVSEVHPDERTPFAAVTSFAADATTRVEARSTRDDVCRRFDAMTGSGNLIYAVRARGRFAHVRTRTVLRQTPPYPPLTEATAHEPIAEFADLEGTLVGFRSPDYTQGISVAGYHLHVIDDARSRGGHVLDFVLEEGELAVSTGSELHLHLPRTSTRIATNGSAAQDADIRRAEGEPSGG